MMTSRSILDQELFPWWSKTKVTGLQKNLKNSTKIFKYYFCDVTLTLLLLEEVIVVFEKVSCAGLVGLDQSEDFGRGWPFYMHLRSLRLGYCLSWAENILGHRGTCVCVTPPLLKQKLIPPFNITFLPTYGRATQPRILEASFAVLGKCSQTAEYIHGHRGYSITPTHSYIKT